MKEETDDPDLLSKNIRTTKQNWTEDPHLNVNAEEAIQITYGNMSGDEIGEGKDDANLQEFFTVCTSAEGEEDVDELIEVILIESRKGNKDILINDVNMINDAVGKTWNL